MKYVYIMQSGSAYKIGVSKDPTTRLNALKTGNCSIKLVYISSRLQNAFAVESALHKKYSAYAIDGEWFSIQNEEQLIDDVRTLINEIGIPYADSNQETDTNNEKIQALIDFALEPQKRALKELTKEIDNIEKENHRLAEQLKELGWANEDIDALIESAIN